MLPELRGRPAQGRPTIHDRLMRGPCALGKMQRALAMSIDCAKQRKTFGKPIAERQAIQIHGAMGEALELPLTLFCRVLRHAQIPRKLLA